MFFFGLVVFTGTVTRPVVWEFPHGYRGWVTVEYEQPSCPPLSSDGIRMVVVVAPTGRACTSSPIQDGWHLTRYEYVLPNGRRQVIPSGGWNTASEITPLSVNTNTKREFLFVGTRQELDRSWENRPDKP